MKKLIILLFLFPVLAFCFSSCKRIDFVLPENWGERNGDAVSDSSLIYGKQWTGNKRKVLIIGVGGCKGDALKKANAPNIKGLLPHAIYSYYAQIQAPTLSGPGWSSLLTGVWSDKHGVKDNTFSGNNFMRYPSVLQYIEGVHPEYKTISVCSEPSINTYLLRNADIKINTNGDDEASKDSAIVHLTNGDPDIMFLELSEVNHAGLQFGFDTTVTQYMEAITKMDGYVGEILQAMNQRPEINKEDWLIILTSEHGGTSSGTGGNSDADKNIFTIFYNKKFQSKELTPATNVLKTVYFTGFHDAGQVIDPTKSFLDFNDYSGFTLQIEVQSPDPLENDDPILTNKDWNSGGNSGWVIAVSGQSWKFNAGGSGRVDIEADAPDLSDGKWHNIAVTVEKNGHLIKLYQDDSMYSYQNYNGFLGNTWSTGSEVRLSTGDDITGLYKGRWGISKFLVANIKIWDTVMTSEDMKQYASPCDTSITPDNPFYHNLVGWWKGTEGGGDTFKDYGPYGQDMQLLADPSWIRQQNDLCNQPLPPSVPTIVDVAPTVLAWFQIPQKAGWGLEGLSWLP